MAAIHPSKMVKIGRRTDPLQYLLSSLVHRELVSLIHQALNFSRVANHAIPGTLFFSMSLSTLVSDVALVGIWSTQTDPLMPPCSGLKHPSTPNCKIRAMLKGSMVSVKRSKQIAGYILLADSRRFSHFCRRGEGGNDRSRPLVVLPSLFMMS